MQPTFCIMSFCLHGLKQALWCNLQQSALLCSVLYSSLTISAQPSGCLENEKTKQKKHTHHPGAGLGYQGRWREKLKMQEAVNQANSDVDWTSAECDRTILISFSSNACHPRTQITLSTTGFGFTEKLCWI